MVLKSPKTFPRTAVTVVGPFLRSSSEMSFLSILSSSANPEVGRKVPHIQQFPAHSRRLGYQAPTLDVWNRYLARFAIE